VLGVKLKTKRAVDDALHNRVSIGLHIILTRGTLVITDHQGWVAYWLQLVTCENHRLLALFLTARLATLYPFYSRLPWPANRTEVYAFAQEPNGENPWEQRGNEHHFTFSLLLLLVCGRLAVRPPHLAAFA
jgi:hypothetical protein